VCLKLLANNRKQLTTQAQAKDMPHLTSRGVNIDKIQRDRQGTRFFEIRDLEGNIIEICDEP
jgi:hypothetical protein